MFWIDIISDQSKGLFCRQNVGVEWLDCIYYTKRVDWMTRPQIAVYFFRNEVGYRCKINYNDLYLVRTWMDISTIFTSYKRVQNSGNPLDSILQQHIYYSIKPVTSDISKFFLIAIQIVNFQDQAQNTLRAESLMTLMRIFASASHWFLYTEIFTNLSFA